MPQVRLGSCHPLVLRASFRLPSQGASEHSVKGAGLALQTVTIILRCGNKRDSFFLRTVPDWDFKWSYEKQPGPALFLQKEGHRCPGRQGQ